MGWFFKDSDDGERGPSGRELDPQGNELSERDQRFIRERRDNGYTGWLDQDARRASCPFCEKPTCAREGFAGRCNG